MLVYTQIKTHRRKFVALTGLTVSEFQFLLPTFSRAYDHLYPIDRTLAGQPRRRLPGGGRKGVLFSPAQRLLLILVYLKTYPLQVIMGELFGLSQPSVNEWIHRLLPILQATLDEVDVLPERNASQFAQSQATGEKEHCLIIDGTERRRQRPKNPEKQALHYSGKKKTHCDKNVVILDAQSECIDFLSATYVGKTHDKKIADSEQIVYPPGTVLYQDTGFQGYEPAVKQTCQAKKKATQQRTQRR